MAEPIKVLLVDDHSIVREGLRLLLGNHPQVKVVGDAGNIADACAAAEREQPDVVLLDIDLGGGDDGLDALPRLLAAAPAARSLILTSASDQETRERAMRRGAMGLVCKDEIAPILFKAIEKVHGGEVWFDRATMGNVLSEMSLGGRKVDPEAKKIESLTVREHEVITLLCEGRTNKQVGEELFISETTVRHHLTSIFGKLDVKGRLPLLLYAFSHGLAHPPKKRES